MRILLPGRSCMEPPEILAAGRRANQRRNRRLAISAKLAEDDFTLGGCQMSTQSATASIRQFTLTSEEINGSTVLLCQGRLTAEATVAFKSHVKSLFPQGKPIVLDMSGVKQMDSSGLGAVVSLWVSARSANCQLQFYNLSAPVKRLLGVTHVLAAFESCGSHLTRLP